MNDYRPRNTTTLGQDTVQVNEGLRSHMLRVYNYMSGGLLITAAVAFAFMNLIADANGFTPLGETLFNTPLKWLIMLAPLGAVMFLSFRINNMSAATAQFTFWIFAALNGVSFSTIGLAFSGQTIASAFLITAVTFGAMSLWGYTTKRDLTGMGSFLMMGVIGLVIASVVNIFLQSSMMQFIISCVSVLVFTGLTAYDTQKIRDFYFEVQGDDEWVGKAATMGALNLYMDFINIFLSMLQLLRGSSDE